MEYECGGVRSKLLSSLGFHGDQSKEHPLSQLDDVRNFLEGLSKKKEGPDQH